VSEVGPHCDLAFAYWIDE